MWGTPRLINSDGGQEKVERPVAPEGWVSVEESLYVGWGLKCFGGRGRGSGGGGGISGGYKEDIFLFFEHFRVCFLGRM